MTLLISFYSSSGIVFAADSAITLAQGGSFIRQGKQSKLHSVSTVGINGAVVGFFGLATVGSQPMDSWLKGKLAAWTGSKTASELGDHLRDALNHEVPLAVRRANPSGFHIGAFENRAGVKVPVMQFVTNIGTLDDKTGRYGKLGVYRSEEHFPNHPSPASSWSEVAPKDLRRKLKTFEREQGFPNWFRNGDLAFSAHVWAGLWFAVNSLRNDLRTRGLKAPEDLDLWASLAKTILSTVGSLYEVFATKGDPLIEGPYKVKVLPWPP